VASPDPASLGWAVRAAAPGADVTGVRGLRDGGSPWLVRLSRHGEERRVVLRVGTSQDPAALATEVAALRLAADHDLPVPRLLAADLDGDPPLVLVEQLPGSSRIPPDRPSTRLRTLGRTAATLHTISLEPASALPERDRPIASVDFAALRRQHAPYPLLLEAEQRLADPPPPQDPAVFVHGDLWQGNALWTGDTLNGLIDWDCAGSGSPGIDLGSLRCDAAICFGLDAAADIQRGWEEVAARTAADVAYWDVVAALSTPPDMGWFPSAIAGQGRPDLTKDVLLRRRDGFLQAALSRLDARPG
jgi:aminoglycoside phosphotransferase (APT) family kinase protein